MSKEETKQLNDLSGKVWVIWSLTFMAVGVLGLSATSIEKYIETRITDSYQKRYGTSADKFLAQYEAWCELTAEERMESPWGHGEYGGAEIQKQLKKTQSGRLRADIVELGLGAKEAHAFADILYGKNWRSEVDKYRKKKEIRDSITVVSVISLLAGTIVSIGNFSRHLPRALRHVRRKAVSWRTPLEKSQKDKEIHSVKQEEDVYEFGDSEQDPDCETDTEDKDSQTADDIDDSDDSDGPVERTEPIHERIGDSVVKSETEFDRAKFEREFGQFGGFQSKSNVATLLSTEPVTSSLNELTQEMSAIREFAAQQQDRVKQLQDGYDWNIIKRFCLRVIRCVDNLDNRIKKLSEKGKKTRDLEDVRDELIFALESSGVERFEPEIGSVYKGQEKSIEALKEKSPTTSKKKVGTISEVIRPGYEYVVSEDEVKLVRIAQVKLYG